MASALSNAKSVYPSYTEAPAAPSRPDETLWGDIGRPYPTNAWWTPACLEGGGWTVHPLPYLLQLRWDVAALCYPDFLTSEKFVSSIFVDNFRVGCREQLDGHRLLRYDDLSATFAWRSTTNATAMICPVVQGAPYLSFRFENATPIITSIFAIAADFRGEFTGHIFRVPLNNQQVWMIYASRDITLHFTANPLVIEAMAPFTGVLRFALEPECEEATQLLNRCRNIVPIGGNVEYCIIGNTLKCVYTFQTEKTAPMVEEADLLMLALPHHARMKAPPALASASPWYRCIKGPVYGVRGTQWHLTLDIVHVSWRSLHKIDAAKAEIVRGALYAEAAMEVHNTDPYAFGKRVAAMGRLAVIADELGEDVIASNVRRRMQRALEPWLTGSNKNAIVYDTVWGGLISTEGALSSGADYGSGMYNDHHFQYGYFVYAAAAIGKGDPGWLRSWWRPVIDLVRDYANPCYDDLHFPRLRHFDHYAGHSWASGLFCFPDGKNQESSSEAIHAYYAIALLGEVMDDAALRDFGAALMHVEILSTQTYWHIPYPDASIYPEPFHLNGTVGIVWSGKVDYGTWFGSNLEYIHGIQMLPFVPIAERLFSVAWIERVHHCIGHLKDDPAVEIGWRGFLWMSFAVIDKETAWRGFAQLDGAPDLGNSITNALYWIATRPASHRLI